MIKVNLIYSISFLITLLSFLITTKTIPLSLYFGQKLNIFDRPSVRNKNCRNITRVGGISIVLGHFISLLVFIILKNYFWSSLIIEKHIIIILSISFFIFVLGLLDDIFQLSPFSRILFEFILSGILWGSGLRIDNFQLLPFFSNFFENRIFIFPDSISLIFTMLWITGVINAINWIDGLDGLAAGISFIISLTLVAISLIYKNFDSAFYAASLAGASLGFLKFNKKPAKILMGDGGAYFIGFNLAAISLIALRIPSNESVEISYLKFFLLGLILFHPIMDMINVIRIRLAKSRSPFFPDRSHMHLQLLDKGLTHESTIKILYLLNIITCSLAIFLTKF